MGYSFRSIVLEYIVGTWLVKARLELRLDEDVVDFDSQVFRVKPRGGEPTSVRSDIRKIHLAERREMFLGIFLLLSLVAARAR